MKIKTEAEALEGMNIIHDMGVSIVVLTSLDSEGPELTTYVSSKFRKELKKTFIMLVIILDIL